MGVGHGEFELSRAVAEPAAESQEGGAVGFDAARLDIDDGVLARDAAGHFTRP